MTTLADSLSIPAVLEHGGKKYELRREPTVLEQGKFQRWLETRAQDVIDRRAYPTAEAKEKDSNALTRDMAAGAYEWGGEVATLAMTTREGLQKYLEIMLNVPAKEVEALLAAKTKELAGLVRRVQAKDPKALREALTMLGLPADFLKPKRPSSSGSARRARRRKKKSSR